MPVFRYFIFVGLVLMGLLIGVGYLQPSAVPTKSPTAQADATTSQDAVQKSAIDHWRAAQQRHDRQQTNTAIVFNDVATLGPTAERLQWEKQLRYVPEGNVMNARAEAKRDTPKQIVEDAAATTAVIGKPAEAATSIRKRVAKPSPRMAYKPRDSWGRPYYHYREPYRSSYGQAWAGRFGFLN